MTTMRPLAEQGMAQAELRRALAVRSEAKRRVDQDVALYGRAHVERTNAARLVAVRADVDRLRAETGLSVSVPR